VSETPIGAQLPAREAVLLGLDRSLLHGLAWTGAAKWGTQALNWAASLIVARLLSPDDYGLVAMAGLYLGLVTLLSEFGLSTAVLNLRDTTAQEIAQANSLAVLFGVLGFGTSCVMAIPLSRFFSAPQLSPVILIMSSTFIIAAFKTVPFALLQRELRFKSLALIEASQSLLLAFSMIGLALLGLRYWTLVLGGVLSAIFSTAAMLRVRSVPFAWPQLGSLRRVVTFSSHILITRLSWYAYSNADVLVAGRVLGKTALGLYNVGWMLANVPLEKTTTLVGQVTPAFFSAVQTDLSSLRRYLLRITEGLAFITFPASMGLALVARDFVLVFLGAKWLGAVIPLQLLAAYAAFRSITPLLPQVLTAIGHSRFVMWTTVACAIVFPITFYVLGSKLGIVGLALTWVVAYPFLVLPLYLRLFDRIELGARAYLEALWPALSATLIMAAAVLAVRRVCCMDTGPGFRFGLEVASGIAVYVLCCLVLHRVRIQPFYAVIKGGWRKTMESTRRRGPLAAGR